jgi:hypothetical protein
MASIAICPQACASEPLELPVGEQRVHDRACVIDPDQALEPPAASLTLDRHHGGSGAAAPHLVLRGQHVGGLQTALLTARERPFPGEPCDIRPRHEAIRHTGHPEPTGRQPHVVGMRLQELRREPARLGHHRVGGVSEGAAAEGHAAAAKRADTGRDRRRVPVADGDRLGLDRQSIGEHLRKRGLVTLAVGTRAGCGRHPAVGLDAHDAALPAERRGLDVHGEADADELAPRAPRRLCAA